LKLTNPGQPSRSDFGEKRRQTLAEEQIFNEREMLTPFAGDFDLIQLSEMGTSLPTHESRELEADIAFGKRAHKHRRGASTRCPAEPLAQFRVYVGRVHGLGRFTAS
jgi:hypothetical protein